MHLQAANDNSQRKRVSGQRRTVSSVLSGLCSRALGRGSGFDGVIIEGILVQSALIVTLISLIYLYR